MSFDALGPGAEIARLNEHDEKTRASDKVWGGIPDADMMLPKCTSSATSAASRSRIGAEHRELLDEINAVPRSRTLSISVIYLTLISFRLAATWSPSPDPRLSLRSSSFAASTRLLSIHRVHTTIWSPGSPHKRSPKTGVCFRTRIV